jgi:hypothetical protein
LGTQIGERIQRSTQPIQMMLKALKVAKEIDDVATIAHCVTQLANMFIYWLPHYSLLMELLQRLRCDCDEILRHLSSFGESSQTADRLFVNQCREYDFLIQSKLYIYIYIIVIFLIFPHVAFSLSHAKLVMSQFYQHTAAGLETPFFPGILIQLASGL